MFALLWIKYCGRFKDFCPCIAMKVGRLSLLTHWGSRCAINIFRTATNGWMLWWDCLFVSVHLFIPPTCWWLWIQKGLCDNRSTNRGGATWLEMNSNGKSNSEPLAVSYQSCVCQNVKSTTKFKMTNWFIYNIYTINMWSPFLILFLR